MTKQTELQWNQMLVHACCSKKNLGFHMFQGATNTFAVCFCWEQFASNWTNKISMTKMGNSLPSNLHQNFFFKIFVYIVCLHNLLPKITIPSILHMYFLNLRKHITICRKAYHWGILSVEVVPGCWKLMRGSRGEHINITGSSLMCFSPPPSPG